MRPICLPVSVHNSPDEDLVGKPMLVASWGNTSPIRRQREYPEPLRATTVAIFFV